MTEMDTKNLPDGWVLVFEYGKFGGSCFYVEVNGVPVAAGSDPHTLELKKVYHEPDRQKIENTLQTKIKRDALDRENETARLRNKRAQRDKARAESARLAMIKAAEGK